MWWFQVKLSIHQDTKAASKENKQHFPRSTINRCHPKRSHQTLSYINCTGFRSANEYISNSLPSYISHCPVMLQDTWPTSVNTSSISETDIRTCIIPRTHNTFRGLFLTAADLRIWNSLPVDWQQPHISMISSGGQLIDLCLLCVAPWKQFNGAVEIFQLNYGYWKIDQQKNCMN